MYLKIKQDQQIQFPYTLGDLRREHPNVSFPKHLTESILSEYRVYLVHSTSMPSYDRLTQSVSQSQPILINGRWTQQWSVTNKLESHAISDVRSHRNKLLVSSDWTQLPDSPVNHEAWSAYRQLLRDVTSQEGFPWGVIWPEQPSM